MFTKIFLFTIITITWLTASAAMEKVYFVAPQDNATVSTTFKLKFGQKGLKVKPSGEELNNKKAGHFHIIVDGSFIPTDELVPANETHIHYGKAQTEAELTLAPGQHTLTLQFADGAHKSLGEKLSQTITVNVK